MRALAFVLGCAWCHIRVQFLRAEPPIGEWLAEGMGTRRLKLELQRRALS